MNKYLEFNINPLICQIGKNPEDFTKKDIIDFVIKNEIRIINFRYAAADGKLKTLNFTVSNYQYLDSILSYGERVDGSSLFPYIEANSSDLYVIPRFSTAYVDPFASIPTLGILCSYFNKDGLPLDLSPENTLKKANKTFQDKTGYRFEAMGELEFYLIDTNDTMFPIQDQKGYHESSPFTKFEGFRTDAMRLIAQSGGQIKYGHSEVGNFVSNGKIYEQNEIEFLVNPVESAADQLVMAKWILRTLAYQYGIDITFSPKVTEGKAGNGLHFHTRIMKGNKSMMIENGKLSDVARTVIAGYIKCASSLTAFGNTNPSSYFRLVPQQEAPTSICWGDRNRSVLIRVPLGWTENHNMMKIVNPLETTTDLEISDRQTVEIRSADGSADIYNMMAGLIVAARTGFEMSDAFKVANETYVDVNIHDNKNKLNTFEQLPTSCHESAIELNIHRSMYEKHGVFSPILIDGIISSLNKFEDKNIRDEIKKNPAMMVDIVKQYYHCG
ncbi:MAG: glutamine synthetase family protein [Bacteroidales bacterium]|nr:glutamine synthetase family protein [Bacteroidales bacterium]